MTANEQLLGSYRPTGGPLEKVGVGAKYVVLLVLTVPAVIVGRWWFSLGVLVVAAVLLLWARVGVRRGLGLGAGTAVVCALLVVVQALSGQVLAGVVLVENLVLALLATRLLTLTTTIPDLVDGIAAACRPLRRVGVDPDQVALAVAVMMRSLPHLMGAFTDLRDAARARGLRRTPLTYVTPVVVRAVAYAQTTGDALAARGLGEDDTRMSS